MLQLRREERPHPSHALEKFRCAAHVDHGVDPRVGRFVDRQSSPQMHGDVSDFSPFAGRGVADEFEFIDRDVEQARLAIDEQREPRRNRGVPDRPAKARLESLIAAVHRQHDGVLPAANQPGESRVKRLHGQTTWMLEREALGTIHG